MQRIAKFLSHAGICSRRQAENLILSGEVHVNNKVVLSPSLKVTNEDLVLVSGKQIELASKPRIWAYYKPLGLVTTHKDELGRDTVFNQLKDKLPRVISVGRLDLNSEGLLLLTNNGDIARLLELPQNKIERVYKVRAFGDISKIINHKSPILIDNIKYDPKSIRICTKQPQFTLNNWFEVILTEGKNREIRKIFAYYGLKVNRLIRTQYGPFHLNNLKIGEFKEHNIKKIYNFIQIYT